MSASRFVPVRDSAPSGRAAPCRFSRRRAQLLVDALEQRLLLSARFVVPAGVPIDRTTTFATLQAALTTMGLTSGDIVQIEPGSAPGNIAIPAPAVANLTIQGDPTAELASIPQFTLSTTLTVGAAQSGFTLKNVNMGLVVGAGTATGSIVGTGNITISGSNIVDISSNVTRGIILGGASNVLINSTFVANTRIYDSIVQVTTPAGGSNNIISRNTFVVNAPTINCVLGYYLGAGAAVTDKVVSNTFIASADDGPACFLNVEEGGISGLTIQGNSFSSPSGTAAISVFSAAHNLTISNNTINLVGGTGIYFQGTADTTTSSLVFNNQISAGPLGVGVDVLIGYATAVMSLNIEGNDFHGSAVGVRVLANAAAPLGGIDLGGGSQGSVGGNNFRGYAGPSSNANAAIFVTNVSTATGTISAQKNLFPTGVTPATVVMDTASKVDISNPLTGNAAFVQTLYEDFLKRPGNTSNASDAGFWVNSVTGGSMTAAQAAASIAHSAEALGVLVDGLYGRYLGRLPDAGGRAYFIGVLQGPGGGVESMVAQLVTSAEYAAQFGSDGNFIQSLYTRLLGRVGTVSDVTFWTNTLPAAGRAAVVNSFVHSGEFRGDVAKQLYGFAPAPLVTTASIFLPLLHRAVAPSAGEINFWANSSSDLLTIDIAFAQTGEYFTNG